MGVVADEALERMRTDDESDWVSRLLRSIGSYIIPSLSEQQRRVLAGYSVGMKSPEIADKLGISMATVAVHRRHAIGRMGARNWTHAVALAIREGLID
jgi:DNA-binding NarL/FixJ family response regulator